MCYFCHVLKNNPQAPRHRSEHCFDKANSRSRVPMDKRVYENGRRPSQVNTNTYANATENASADTDANCVICMDKPRAIAFIPCGHVSTCESCSSALSQCPLCRQNITTKQKLYFS